MERVTQQLPNAAREIFLGHLDTSTPCSAPQPPHPMCWQSLNIDNRYQQHQAEQQIPSGGKFQIPRPTSGKFHAYLPILADVR